MEPVSTILVTRYARIRSMSASQINRAARSSDLIREKLLENLRAGASHAAEALVLESAEALVLAGGVLAIQDS